MTQASIFNIMFSNSDLKNATPSNLIDWAPIPMHTSAQSQASFDEQELVIKAALKAMAQYQNFSTSHPKGIIVAGGPGMGKTSCLQFIGLVARSRGLNVGQTALMLE